MKHSLGILKNPKHFLPNRNIIFRKYIPCIASIHTDSGNNIKYFYVFREERSLLVQCGHGKQPQRQRSDSTPKIFVSNRKPKTLTPRVTRSKEAGGSSNVSEPGPEFRSDSPKVLTKDYVPKRPGSLPVHRSALPVESPQSRVTNKHFLPSPFSRDMVPSRISSVTAPVSRQQQELRDMLGGDGAFTQKARQKIKRTFRALDAITGYGDPRDVMLPIAEEVNRYTSADYAKKHRYPQNIRIAPQLTKVIKEDIANRMGRPKQHEIKTNDVKLFNKDQPTLGRQHRNLLIFNWLNALDEDDFDSKSEPDIYDIEGDDLGHVGNRLGTGMVGRSVEDYDTMSGDMSPRVSDEERWGDDSRDWGSIIIPPMD